MSANNSCNDQKLPDDHYEIDKIYGRRILNGTLQYLVSWTNYSSRHDSWVDAEDMNAPAFIQQYNSNINALLSNQPPASYRSLVRYVGRSPRNTMNYHIENICGMKIVSNRVRYLVKWKNHPMQQGSWVPREVISAAYLIHQFEQDCIYRFLN